MHVIYQACYASCGLTAPRSHPVFEMFAAKAGRAVDDEVTQILWKHVYRVFIEAVDACDNGVNMYDTDAAPKCASSHSAFVIMCQCSGPY